MEWACAPAVERHGRRKVHPIGRRAEMSAWNDYVTAALLGAEKASPPALPAQIEPALGGTLPPEARFLTQAGALAFWRRAGWKPGRRATDMQPAESEATKPVPRAGVAH